MQNVTTLLPTVVVQIDSSKGSHKLRCLLDSGSKYSRISSKVSKTLKLTTLTLDQKTIRPITLKSMYEPDTIIETTLRVEDRISIHTPEKSLAKFIQFKFSNMMLADVNFFKSRPIDGILGIDIYSRVINEGMLCRSGLPTAQNTIFGWAIYGPCSTGTH